MTALRDITEETRVKASIQRLLTAGTTLVVLVGTAVLVWSRQENQVANLSQMVMKHDIQLNEFSGEITSLKVQLATQTEILKYIARDRRGPIPEALK